MTNYRQPHSTHLLTNLLNITTLNVNGIHNDNKRNDLYEFIRINNIHIALIQETHSTPDTAKQWEKEWKGKSYWHSGPNNKTSGVAILFNEKHNIQILNISKDQKGQMIKCSLQVEQEIFQIINIYAATKPPDKISFYKKLNTFEKNQKTILAGDFNMVENLFLDRQRGNSSNTHLLGLDHLNKHKQQHNLIEIWRKHNPHTRHFTYHNGNNTIHSRIDHIYITNTLKTKSSKIIPTPLSDHDSVRGCYSPNNQKRNKKTRSVET